MQFTHEASATVDAPPHLVLADWSDVGRLPCILTHIRAIAPGEAEDLGRLVIMLDGSHIEFAAQRTMCDRETICWQNLGHEDFEYILTVQVRPVEHGAHVHINCCYDPPGFLTDILETLGFSRTFQRILEADLRRYAECFHKHPCGLLSLPPGGAPGKALKALGITE
jgi:uncharacterized membrane protein